MKTITTLTALVLAGSSALLGGCAGNSAPPASYPVASSSVQTEIGTVDSIQSTRVGSGQTSGTGAVVGGLVGALAGNQVGSGSGRTAATVAGAAGGALIGNQVEQARGTQVHDAYQINVRLDDGSYRSVVQDTLADVRVGSRVRVIDGRVVRY